MSRVSSQAKTSIYLSIPFLFTPYSRYFTYGREASILVGGNQAVPEGNPRSYLSCWTSFQHTVGESMSISWDRTHRAGMGERAPWSLHCTHGRWAITIWGAVTKFNAFILTVVCMLQLSWCPKNFSSVETVTSLCLLQACRCCLLVNISVSSSPCASCSTGF